MSANPSERQRKEMQPALIGIDSARYLMSCAYFGGLNSSACGPMGVDPRAVRLVDVYITAGIALQATNWLTVDACRLCNFEQTTWIWLAPTCWLS